MVNELTMTVLTSVEQRDSCAPMITAIVDANSFYTVAIIDGTFIKWYVRDIHGYDLLKGYDTYTSKSGCTVVPYEHWNIGKVLLLENKTNDFVTRRQNETIDTSNILDEFDFVYLNLNENDSFFSPSWYAKFSSMT